MSLLEYLYLKNPEEFTPVFSNLGEEDVASLYDRIKALSPQLAHEFRELVTDLQCHEQGKLAALFAQGVRVGAQLKVELQEPYENYLDRTVRF